MSEIKLYAEGWVATVLTGPSRDGFYQVSGTVAGETNTKALEGASHVLNVFAFGRVAFIRTAPEAVSETDFDTRETRHKAFVRFSYKLEAGGWHYPDSVVTVPIGAAV